MRGILPRASTQGYLVLRLTGIPLLLERGWARDVLPCSLLAASQRAYLCEHVHVHNLPCYPVAPSFCPVLHTPRNTHLSTVGLRPLAAVLTGHPALSSLDLRDNVRLFTKEVAKPP